jgi:MFS family permease
MSDVDNQIATVTPALAHVRRNVTLIHLYTLCASSLFMIPILVPFYKDHLGLTFGDFLFGEAVFATFMVLLEVPSGYISDLWKRKHVLALSAVVFASALVVLCLAQSLFMVCVAQVVFAIAVSLFSGTVNAILYDTLAEAGMESDYRRIEGKRTAIGFYSIAISAALGSLMYKVDPLLPFYATVATHILQALCILYLHEPERHKLPVQKHPLADIMVTMRFCLHGHAEIAKLIFLGAVCFATTKVVMWAQQPYYGIAGVDVAWFGLLAGCGWMMSGFASHFGHKLDRAHSTAGSLMVILLLLSLLVGAAGLAGGVFGIVPLLFATALYGLGWPRLQDAVNSEVDGTRRATVLSTASLMVQLFSIPLMAGFGTVVDTVGIEVGLLSLAAILLLVAVSVRTVPILKRRIIAKRLTE